MPRRRHSHPRPTTRRGAHATRRPARLRPRDARHGGPRPVVVPARVRAEIDALLLASAADDAPAAVPSVELDRLDGVRITVADPGGGAARRVSPLEALGLAPAADRRR